MKHACFRIPVKAEPNSVNKSAILHVQQYIVLDESKCFTMKAVISFSFEGIDKGFLCPFLTCLFSLKFDVIYRPDEACSGIVNY